MDVQGCISGGCLRGQAPARRGLRRIVLVWTLVLAQLAMLSAAALAQSRVGPNPPSNFKVGPLPALCASAPTGRVCINAAVYYLDRARARLHQGPYRLPANFVRLKPSRQLFILIDLDRILYHLSPITGLTPALDRIALGGRPGDPGVLGDGDPLMRAPGVETTSNWASGFANVVLAYEAWMYDDGPGSSNLHCTPANHTGCWGHRQDILTRFRAPGPSAMGAAAGRDSHGAAGYAVLLAKGRSSYTRGYSYRWRQAAADGAGSHTYRVARPDTRTVSFGRPSIQGTTLVVPLRAPKGIALRCSLRRRTAGGWSSARFHSCGSTARFPGIRPGTYRVSVRSVLGLVATELTIT
jgi:hypothetical protein